ncbi:hypothetical protein AVEN_153417-1 [Araneus ventricosus]|uniref:Uncharacterized protein n=1 Tax=Araneus ventricosus TaxID=182803 RepID=A0A4Y2EBN5_ARAVE|nr:hypothetical protein AVEN_153417-1 [Araneus ventricosus]
MRNFNWFTVARKGAVKTMSTTHSNVKKTKELISEDLDSHMQKIHVPMERASMTANMLPRVWREMDYRMDVAYVILEYGVKWTTAWMLPM